MASTRHPPIEPEGGVEAAAVHRPARRFGCGFAALGCIADFQIGQAQELSGVLPAARPADRGIRDAADWESCAVFAARFMTGEQVGMEPALTVPLPTLFHPAEESWGSPVSWTRGATLDSSKPPMIPRSELGASPPAASLGSVAHKAAGAPFPPRGSRAQSAQRIRGGLASLSLGFLFCLAPALPAADTTPQIVKGRIDARLMRQPAVSATQIAFVYAGDIWVVPKAGGTAVRLSSPRGEEEFPRFSPDGSTLAFSGNYDGNVDIYTMPAGGGLPKRLTHHGAADRVVNWYPDGKSILFASGMTSASYRFNQLFKVSADGGLPEKLPVPYGEFGAISPDGKILAYTPISVDFRTWKRYRGGMNPDIWFFDLEKLTAKNVTHNDANDSDPMWHDDTLYFLSDRDAYKRDNLWAYETKKGTFRPVTSFKDYDIHFPSIGPEDIVFENGGRLHLLELATEKHHAVEIEVVTDRATLKPRQENVAGYIHGSGISPTGKRAVFEARGDLFTVPAEHGIVRNITRSSGVAERFPAWSPDGKWIAYFSDRSGEYELTIRPADRAGDEQKLTALGAGFRYQPFWSPDSRKIAFIDKAMQVRVYDFDTQQTTVIDRELWQYHGGLSGFRPSWSADSRWLAYPGDLDNRQSAIVLYDFKHHQRHPVTTGFYDDGDPVFDPDGKYLYFQSSRSFHPTYSELGDSSWVYANADRLIAVPLRQDVSSPLAPRNDEEGEKTADKEDEKKDGAKDGKKKADATSEKSDAQEADKKSDQKDEKKPKPVEIDLADFERRAVVLPPKAGRYADLEAAPGKLIYRRYPRAGAEDGKSPVLFWDLEKREEKTILDDADGVKLSADHQKLLAWKSGSYSIVEAKEGQKLDKKLATGDFETAIDPLAEWRQIFTDAWRLERDYFYDPGLHGVDWNAMRERYGKLLADAVTRWDVNYVIGELIAELNSSHTYRGGGDVEAGPQRGVGYLGVDFALENGAYRIKKIIDDAPWDTEVRSPLRQSGTNTITEGDYLLAVNGAPIDTTQDPWAAFQGLADQTVQLTVNAKPALDGARDVLVHTLASEARLRNLAWIESNRKHVDEATHGQVGYVYVPDTGVSGQNELVRQFRAQYHKPGLIIDERFNSGGQIPDRFIELLHRPRLNFWAVRDGRDWETPWISHPGPMAMLINGWSGSGGDAFPFYFKKAGLGPLIGLRTWGGLIGMTGVPGLIDNGSVTVPTFGIYSTNDQWIIEGYGVDPDIKIVDDPAQMAKGVDPQLERAIAEVLKEIKHHPPPEPRKPKYPNRAGL